MQLSKKALAEFQAIYYEEYGVALPDNEAEEMACRILQLFAIIYRPLPAVDVDSFDGDRMVERKDQPCSKDGTSSSEHE